MMQQVDQIVLGNELQCHRFVITNSALRLELRRRQVSDDVCEELIVRTPQRYQQRPGGVLEVLSADVAVLVVAGEVELRLERGAHETLMVIGGRVDQVAYKLLTRPAAGAQGRRLSSSPT